MSGSSSIWSKVFPLRPFRDRAAAAVPPDHIGGDVIRIGCNKRIERRIAARWCCKCQDRGKRSQTRDSLAHTHRTLLRSVLPCVLRRRIGNGGASPRRAFVAMTDHRLVRCTDLESRVSTLTPRNDTDIVMHTADLLDAWFIRDRRQCRPPHRGHVVDTVFIARQRKKGREQPDGCECRSCAPRAHTVPAPLWPPATTGPHRRCLTGFKLY